MLFQIDATKSDKAQIRLTHATDPGELRLRIRYDGSSQAAFHNTLTYREASALARGILALIEGRPDIGLGGGR